MKHQSSIFISYRHADTADKAEHLLTLLEAEGYKGRVSFDRENLDGQFDLEILQRLDNCTDFIVILGENTLNGIKDEDTVWYQRLAECSVDEFRTIEADMKRSGAQLDFVRLEIARAIAKGKHIIPVVPVTTPEYNFDRLELTDDILLLIKQQAEKYQDSKDFLYRDIVPRIIKRLKTRPNKRPLLKWFVAAVSLLVIAVGIVVGVRWNQERELLRQCRIQVDYESLANDSWGFVTGECKDSINAFNELKGSGYTSINDALGTDKRDSIQIQWSNECSLQQIRVIKQLVNNMMLVPAGTFVMGTDREEGLDNPTHEVTIEHEFYLCKFELTEREWNVIMKDSIQGNDVLPMTDISWYECQNLIGTLTRLTGLTFTLPSEEQWEYAASYGHPEWMYAGGDKARDVAVFGINDKQDVNSKMPNALDIYCLSGNVAEWTNDGNEIRKRVRGGSYHSEEEEVTVTFTESASPDMGSMYIGMRLLLIK